jgi:hypothetical protein
MWIFAGVLRNRRSRRRGISEQVPAITPSDADRCDKSATWQNRLAGDTSLVYNLALYDGFGAASRGAAKPVFATDGGGQFEVNPASKQSSKKSAGIECLVRSEAFFTDIARHNMTPSSATEGTSSSNVWAVTDVIAAPLLEALLPSTIPGYRGRTTTSAYHHELRVSEVLGVYVSDFGNSLSISIADLNNQPKMYRNFMTGGGLRQSSSGNSFGIAFRQASLQGSAGYGLVLGGASGVVGMAQVSQPILFSIGQFSPQASPQASPQFSPHQASPQFSPQASPQFSPQASPQFSPQASPQFSPQASPQFSPQASPQFSPQASPQFSPHQASPQFSPQASPQFSPHQASPQFSPQASPQASPQFSPQASPQASPQFSPQASPQVSPQASPQFSPQASPQFSPGGLSQALIVFSQSVLGKKPTLNAGQAPMTESQASAVLQSSGIDLAQLSSTSQASPFSLSQASGFDGSYIRPFGKDTGHDVAGWDMWDSRTKIGTMILGINDRVALLIEGTNLLNPNALMELSDALDFDEINRVIESHGK